MDLSFKSIAFELKYASPQIDAVYVSLDIANCGPQKVPVFMLQRYKGLPEDFRQYLCKIQDSKENPINILFEPHTLAKNENHDDWDLLNYD